jgi:carboxymethylenebutenolidase
MPMQQPEGYLSVPLSGKGKPVLVLHAWWGLNDTLKTFCKRLSDPGFVVFAPDLYHGKIAETIPDAESLSGALNPERAKADIADSLRFLKEKCETTNQRLAVIGFSLGAYFALDLSTSYPESVHSVVVFYGTGPIDFTAAKAKYLGHFAASDPYEPRSEVDKLESNLRNAGCQVSFYHYSNTGHWFSEQDRPEAYNQEAAELAWDRTLAFLKE